MHCDEKCVTISSVFNVRKDFMKTLKTVIALSLCAATLFASGCKSKEEKKNTTTAATTTTTTAATTTTAPPTTTTVATTPAPKPVPKGEFNNLTGLYTLSDEAVGKRPAAIMINNISVSLPQYGIYDADIMYECLVEGGITRMMGVYGDYTKVPNVCSIRSCRYYYPIFAMGYDAIYYHYGLDKTVAQDTLNRLDTDHLDGGYYPELFKRDNNRVQYYSTEHTIYLKGSAIPSTLKNYGFRTDISDSYNKPAFDFKDSASAISEEKCTTATVNFSNSYYSTFKYNSETKTYLKHHNGNKHMDSALNKQLEYTNVFYLETTTEVINWNNGLISLNWKGGNGYYISNGTIRPITWSKSSETAPIVFKNTDGTALEVNPGKSYIGISPKNTLSYS